MNTEERRRQSRGGEGRRGSFRELASTTIGSQQNPVILLRTDVVLAKLSKQVLRSERCVQYTPLISSLFLERRPRLKLDQRSSASPVPRTLKLSDTAKRQVDSQE